MAGRRGLDRVIVIVLLAGAVVFALLLAGVGSDMLTDPASYTPPASPGATYSP